MAAVIRYDRLSCGMPVCIQTSDESPLFSISVWIKGGSAQDPADKEGLAHLCEHLLLCPLANANTRAHRTQLKTGALINAFTDPEWVVISAQVPMEQAKLLINILAALVRNPYCEPRGFAVEKEVILQELRGEDPGPAELLARIFHESAFDSNPRVRPVGGTPATLSALKINDAREYFTRFLNASKMLITAYGNVSIWDLTTMLNESFQDFPETFNSSDFLNIETATAARSLPDYRPIRIHWEMANMGSGYGVLAGFGSVPRNTEKYWTALAFEVFMADGPGSLLTRWLRNERRWIYGIVSMTEGFSSWGCQYFLMRLSHHRTEEAVNYLGERWRALPEFVTEERMAALRNRLASRALSSLASLQDRMTLMRDTVPAGSGKSGTLDGGLEAVIIRRAGELNADDFLSYIRQYAKWDLVSLVCAPI